MRTPRAISVRLDPKVNKRAQALAVHVDAEDWQLGEIRAGLKDLNERRTVAHDRVSKWLRCWGTADGSRAPK